MAKLPISVFIITQNEADRVPVTINSVKDWVDEIVVVDSGSDDDTVSICKKLGAKTFFHEWQGYGLQKRFAESKCRHDWVFNLDADEEITPKLRDEIIALFSKNEPEIKAYNIKRKMLFINEDTPPLFAPSDYFLRLYHRKYASFSDSTVHDKVHVHTGKTATLRAYLLHRCFRSYTHWVDKINFYSSMQAEDRFTRNKPIASYRILVEPFAAFFKAYILRRYFVYGIDGISYSLLYVHARTLRLAKIRERFKKG